jgi:hypothetical protein
MRACWHDTHPILELANEMVGRLYHMIEQVIPYMVHRLHQQYYLRIVHERHYQIPIILLEPFIRTLVNNMKQVHTRNRGKNACVTATAPNTLTSNVDRN